MDRRVKRTKKILYEALLTLMQNKSINKITVKELTELADINRKTFYLHYTDIFDMIDQIKENILLEFNDIISKHKFTSVTKEDLYLLLNEIIIFIDTNYDILSILLGPHINADSNFIYKLKIIMKERCIDIWSNIFPNGNLKNYDYFYSFAFSGFIGLIQNWISLERQDSIEYLTKLSNGILNTCSIILNQPELD